MPCGSCFSLVGNRASCWALMTIDPGTLGLLTSLTWALPLVILVGKPALENVHNEKAVFWVIYVNTLFDGFLSLLKVIPDCE